jgi:RNA polymerase sigma-70 factor (ECF subfamily)
LDGTLSEVYTAHAPAIWRTLRRLGVADAQLDDAIQDVFLVVHRRCKQFEGRCNLRTWIIGIAVRVAKDYRRAAVRHARRLDRLALCLASGRDVATCPVDANERREASELLHGLLAALPDEQRDVLVLVELEELTVREAADALGLGVRTCQRRLRAGVEAMSTAVTRFLQTDRRSHP